MNIRPTFRSFLARGGLVVRELRTYDTTYGHTYGRSFSTAVRTGRTYGRARTASADRAAVHTGGTTKKLCAQCFFLPYVPYVRLVRMGQPCVRPVQRYQIIYLFIVDRHKLYHVHALCVSVSVCNKSNILHCRYVRLMRMDSRTYGLYIRMSKMNVRTYGCTYGPVRLLGVSPLGVYNRNIVSENGDFLALCVDISETVRDTSNVTIND